MTDNWKNVKNTNKKIKNIKEEEHFLFNILNNGGCMRCINKSCKINEKHGINFPEKLSTFVQNPTYITGIEKSIQNANLDFNGKKPFFTTCNYTNKNCRNCEEGRVKYIIFNNEKITLCYPALTAIRFKVTVGLHIDIKLILKGTKYEVSAIPIAIEIKKIENVQVDKKQELNSEENWPDLCSNGLSEKSSLSDNICPDKLTVKNTKHVNTNSSLFYEKLMGRNEEYSEVPSKNNRIQLNIERTSLNYPSENIFNFAETENINSDKSCVKKDDPISIDNSILNEKNNSILIEKDNKIKDLTHQNIFLKEEIVKLYNKNLILEDKNRKEMFIINNEHKYDEILENVKHLNTKITQQFFETNYQQYVLI
jgi:hypothetical protein